MEQPERNWEGTKMGLNARVKCNCYRDGKTTEPPFPREILVLEPDGDLSLTVPREGHEDLYDAYYAWSGSACEHPQQDYAEIWLGTWGGVRGFKHDVSAVGREHVSTLLAVIPDLNGGVVTPSQAAKALEEVEYLAGLPGFGKSIMLVDLDTGLVVRALEPGVERDVQPYAWANLVFNGTEVTICLGSPRDGWTPSFTATRFTQVVLEWESERPTLVELCNVETGCRLVRKGCFFAVNHKGPGEDEVVYPTNLGVIYRNSYEATLDSLRKIFRASVETGNPVIWC